MESLKGIGYLTNLETLRIKDQRQLSSLEGLDGRLTNLMPWKYRIAVSQA